MSEIDCSHWNLNEVDLTELVDQLVRMFNQGTGHYGLFVGDKGILPRQDKDRIYKKLKEIRERHDPEW